MKQFMRQRQQGMTFIGLLCLLAIVGMIGYAVIRLIPVYLNYMKISRTMEMTATEVKGENPDPGNIRRILERHWQIEDPTVVEAKDIEITKDNGGVSMHVTYDDVVPYMSNVSLSVHFDKTVKVQ
jgi:Tfp pilus assembly major pilin PilA